MRKRKGFTLIELIVVMVILAILVLLGVPKYKEYTKQAEITKLTVECKELEKASQQYYMRHDDWPRLKDEAYTASEVTMFGERILDKTGAVVVLDSAGSYYDIDYSKLSNYISKPKDSENYILQNPVGNVYAVEEITEESKNRLTVSEPEISNSKPSVVISMSPEQALTTSTLITWSLTSSDVDDDEIINIEWEGKQDIYSIEGTYIVRLRVQDEHGLWSDWVEKEFYVINSDGVKQIVAGSDHTVALMNDGTVKSWGRNNFGQLGNSTNIGTDNSNPIPTTIVGLNGVKEIIAGGFHTIAILEDGSIKSWGYNEYGQLGRNTNVGTGNPNSIPTTIDGLSNVKEISAGYDYTVALMNDGTVKSWGRNYSGQLGISTNVGTSTANSIPTTIVGLNNVKQILASEFFTLALLEDGTVKSWGRNYYGQLGVSTNVGTTTANPTPTTIVGLSNVKQIDAGSNHALALLEDGTVKAWGRNIEGQLGRSANSNSNPTPTTIVGLTGVREIVAGGNFTFALLENGNVKSWGANGLGQLGIGNTTQQNSPVLVSNLSNVKSITTGSYHTVALLGDGTLMSWGKNTYGQLGISINVGTNTANSTPTGVID